MLILVTFYLLIKSQKVQQFVTSNLKLETEELSLEPVDVLQQLLDTETVVKKSESDYHLDKEKLFQVVQELWLVSLQVEEELINLY